MLILKVLIVYAAFAGVFLWGWKRFFDEFGPT